jgi:hypothetical protein
MASYGQSSSIFRARAAGSASAGTWSRSAALLQKQHAISSRIHLMAQLPLFEISTPPHSYDVAITPEIERALADHAPVAIGVSVGKDSSAVAIRTFDYLDDCGHRGPRLLIHCDLGEVEWLESLPTCERLAVSLGTELLVLRRRRPAGGSAGKTTNNGTPSWNAFASFCRGVRLPLGSVRAS